MKHRIWTGAFFVFFTIAANISVIANQYQIQGPKSIILDSNIYSAQSEGEVLGSFANNSIILDGILNPNEWNFACNATFSVQCGSLTYGVTLMVQNNLTTLFIGTIITGAVFNDTANWMYFWMDNNNSGRVYEGMEDQKQAPFNMVDPTDWYYLNSSGIYIFDSFGGDNEKVTYCSLTNTTIGMVPYTYMEMQFPLNSGHWTDCQLEIGQVYGLVFAYFDGNQGWSDSYYGYFPVNPKTYTGDNGTLRFRVYSGYFGGLYGQLGFTPYYWNVTTSLMDPSVQGIYGCTMSTLLANQTWYSADSGEWVLGDMVNGTLFQYFMNKSTETILDTQMLSIANGTYTKDGKGIPGNVLGYFGFWVPFSQGLLPPGLKQMIFSYLFGIQNISIMAQTFAYVLNQTFFSSTLKAVDFDEDLMQVIAYNATGGGNNDTLARFCYDADDGSFMLRNLTIYHAAIAPGNLLFVMKSILASNLIPSSNSEEPDDGDGDNPTDEPDYMIWWVVGVIAGAVGVIIVAIIRIRSSSTRNDSFKKG